MQQHWFPTALISNSTDLQQHWFPTALICNSTDLRNVNCFYKYICSQHYYISVKPGTRMRTKWFANRSRTVREPNTRMCGWNCEPEPALCHLQAVRITFAANHNLSGFCGNTKGIGCTGKHGVSYVRLRFVENYFTMHQAQTVRKLFGSHGSAGLYSAVIGVLMFHKCPRALIKYYMLCALISNSFTTFEKYLKTERIHVTIYP